MSDIPNPEPPVDSPALEVPETDPRDARIAELEAEAQKLRYALAEADNMRKRAQRDAEETAKFANSRFAQDLLVVADDFERALAALPAEGGGEAVERIRSGISGTGRQLTQVFERHGIKRMQVLGQPFNPHHHEAMFEAPAGDAAPGTVVQEVQAGYLLHDRLLRPARVGIAQAGEIKLDQTV